MRIYNTLTRQKEDFIPIEEGQAKIYVCGPTVYNYIHIGNARPIVIFDTLRRFLLFMGYDVKYVSNFTDVDDKIINRAEKEGISCKDLTDKYIGAYLEDTTGLNILEENTIHPKATDYVEKMVDFIAGLVDKGAAYNVGGNVYFDISKAEDYGKLSKKNIEELKAGARVDKSDEKKNPLDFALWKKQKDEKEPAWPSPWGMGRPGWHIECSTMARSILGDTIDIHCGGEDLEFPHHENEIAQSESLTGKDFAHYWMHNGMINVDNEKMSKSLGNFFLVREVAETYHREVLRLWLLTSHYRHPINFSTEAMDHAKAGLDRLYNAKDKLTRLEGTGREGKLDPALSAKVAELKASFIEAMSDDLNTADALSKVFDLVSLVNTDINEGSSKETIDYVRKTFMELTDVLGLVYREKEDLDSRIEGLIAEREEARKNKDYAKADAIRDQLMEEGIELEDTKTGVVWKKRD